MPDFWDVLADEAAAESPLWGESLLPGHVQRREQVFSSLCSPEFALGVESCAMSGRPATALTTPSPGQANNGMTKRSSSRCVSRASERNASVRRSRRRRVTGKDAMGEMYVE